jgi:protein O-GlcNAc transferase
MSAPGRNEPCHCGSGRKYKHCCLRREPANGAAASEPVFEILRSALEMHRAGRLAQAEALYREALRVRPDQPTIHYHLGLIDAHGGRLEQAASRYRQAIALDPDFPEALNNLGHACNGLGRWGEAIPYLERAVALRPRYARARNNLGIALDELGRAEEAVAAYRQAIADDPACCEAHYNLGTTLLTQGHVEEALECFERALALKPGYALAQLNLGNAYLARGDLARARTSLKRAVEIAPDLAIAHDSNVFILNYLSLSNEAAFAAHRQYAERFEAPLKGAWQPHPNDKDPERRLKVGYVSADLRTHSVASFIEPILAQHDKTGFEIYAYHSSTIHDATTERLMSHVAHWRSCKALSDEALAERIRADGIDILVDLSGHSTGNRLPMFAHRPAPVQVTYLGYPATTGLDAVDYRLVTADTDPPGAESFHSERLFRLPRSLWCYRPNAQMPEPRMQTPARTRREIYFGSTNNVAKISDATIASWSRILKAVPGSRLVMTNLAEGEARRLILSRFGTRGIGPDRIILHGKLPAEEFYSLLGGIDIALDPFPYNGTTTSCESLWMGVPLITLIGKSSAGRSGYALLRTIGLPELAAAGEDEYVWLAIDLAADLGRLDRLRSSMRRRMEESALRDEPGVTGDIEAAYRAMWREWCSRDGT